MHQIAHKLWVGSQTDFEALDGPFGTDWGVVHAARDPWHRQLLGYTGRGAPTDHPEYLFARRGNRLYLNLVDAADPKYISAGAISAAIRFIDEWMEANGDEAANPNALLICCNQGGSRAPTLGMLYLAPQLPQDFEVAEDEYRKICPSYAPGAGMRQFARMSWPMYHARPNYGLLSADTVPIGMLLPNDATALDTAQQIWQRLCETMKTDPALARDQLMRTLVQAFTAADTDKQERHHGQARTGPRK